MGRYISRFLVKRFEVQKIVASKYWIFFGMVGYIVALHSLYLRTVRSRTLQVRLLFSTTHYYPRRT